MNTQAERLLNHFNEGKTITSLEAYSQLGITQLGARIHDLEQRGHLISRKMIEVKNRFGESCHVKEYWLSIAESDYSETYECEAA